MSVLDSLRRVAALSGCAGDDDDIAVLASALGVPMSAITWDIPSQSYGPESPISETEGE